VTAPPGEPGPIFGFRNDPGFVHAPSLDHAATVAVLRSGHLTRFGRTSDPEADPLAIDLSSERARTAQYLLDGVRSGQTVAALLGYRFERALHERGLDVFIEPFRFIAPIVSTGRRLGSRSSRCRRTMWWTGLSSCGKAESRPIAPRCSCSPAPELRCRRS
jgi:hypothetical protein